jgi:glutaminyl-peptide cyclotransferase
MTTACKFVPARVAKGTVIMDDSKFIRTRKLSRRVLILYGTILLGCAILAGWVFFGKRGAENGTAAAISAMRLEDIPFNGARAYEYLKQLCAIGPRRSGSAGMDAQQKLLTEHFKKLGAVVEFQRFAVRHPLNESRVHMANMLIQWNPESTDRILLCAHYDTLPFPMLDQHDPRGIFMGANDNAGGVALLMELANDIRKINCKFGVDFLLLDGEEFIFSPRDRFFLGSEYFAREYVKNPPKYRYRWGVLLDMISDKDLQIYEERNSLGWKDASALMEEIWSTAARLGVSEFIPHPKYDIEDDHIMLHNIGGIACIDVIDFDYPAWHTQADKPDNCSALSLAKVGWVISEWLKTAK